jgi:glutamate---cysteine ligase / carboxylate-amine ligase
LAAVEHAFGRRPPFRLGIEEELLLVDPVTLRLADQASALHERLTPAGGAVTTDVYEALIELSTPVVAGAAEGFAALRGLRAQVRDAGATALGAGLHPAAPFGEVEHVAEPRYAAIRDAMRGLLERTPTAALHVHVGMPDPETAIAVCNRLRAHLPLLQALAAHSPYWHGRDSGFASARSMVFRAFPRAIVPPELAGWEHYVDLVGWWEAVADVPDYTYLWWDVRPSPRLGTVEVRAMDAQSRLASAAGLAALVHALACACADGHEEAMPPAEALAESSFRAGRDGLAATVWWRGALRPVPEVAGDALALARAYARDLDGADALAEIERILREGGGADRMRAAHAAGGLDEVLSRLVAESAPESGELPDPSAYSSTQTTSPIESQP